MLYIMIKPPPAELRQVCARRSTYGLDDSYPADRLHCTMLRLGDEADWPSSRLEQLRTLLGTISAEPFPVAFDLIAGNLLRGARGMPLAAAFHRVLRQKAEMCGVTIEHNFWLHLTLAYRGVAIAAARKIEPISWMVEEFLLIRSDRGHEPLGRWPLQQRQLALAL
ncbi:2'-5' RNA ligase family protein [Sphingomonas panacisoli]|uniref:2'-5' RNA ligase family protein n=1 Tax=Sphingomonas panacisoli TaxID=1813879 RepID=A0A5B8LM98_9SPHN|nr:2'-5' RNA ligase family protein [Sphingomonas panacisoli]QDZ08785.1 2'-5' RNA ligase family protein [Sphingomonas panacisoli]